MPLNDLITANGILPALRVNTKKSAIYEMSERASAVSGLGGREIYDAVLQRERLGSTGVGNGIAIPHGKLAVCPRIIGVFARFERPVDFDSLDGAPVDLAFMLVAPEAAGADHLKALARIARVLRDPRVVAKLRATREADGLFGLLTQLTTPNAA